MSATKTQLASFKDLDIANLDETVLAAIRNLGEATRLQICDYTSLTINSVSGACARLKVQLEVHVVRHVKNPESNKLNEVLSTKRPVVALVTKRSRKGELKSLRTETQLQKIELENAQKQAAFAQKQAADAQKQAADAQKQLQLVINMLRYIVQQDASIAKLAAEFKKRSN